MTSLVTDQTRIKDLCSKIKDSIICIPHANTDENIIDILKGYDTDVAHPTIDGHIIFKHNGNFYKFVKPDDDFFTNLISSTDSALFAQQNIKAFSGYSNIKNVLGFSEEEIDSLNIEILDKPIMLSDDCVFFMMTFKNGKQFLDFVAWSRTGGSCNFSNRCDFNLTHSSDCHHGSYFTQSIKINNKKNPCDFIVGGIGYNSTPLMSADYTHQKPSSCCYSPSTNTIYVMPFQQTKAILGPQNTTLASAVVQSDGRGKIKVTPYTCVPENDSSGNAIIYNTTSKLTCNLPARCFEYADKTEVEDEYDVVEAPIEDIESVDSNGVDVPDKSVFQFITPGATIMDIDNSVVMDYLGNIIDLSAASSASAQSKAKFNPALFSTGQYPKAVSNGSIEPATKTVNNLVSKIDKSKLCVLHFTEESSKLFSEDCAKLISNDMKITCLMIVSVNIESDGILDTLENIKLSFTKYANHKSIILAKSINTGKYYWVRGIRWVRSGASAEGNKVYNFGEEFPSTMVEQINESPFPVRCDTLQYDSTIVKQSDVDALIGSLDFSALIEKQDDVVELFIQMSSLVQQDKFKDFKTKCLKSLKEKQETYSKEFKSKLAKMVRKQFDGDDSVELKKEVDGLKHTIKTLKANSILKNLTRTITGITYDGGASSKAASKALDNTLREDLIKDNVSIVNGMTNEDIWDYLEDIDTFIVGQLREESYHLIIDMLDKVSSNTFTGPDQPIVGFHPTCGELDGCTVSVLGQQIEEKDIPHDFRGIVSLLCGETETYSSIPIAVLEQFTNLDDPRYFKWIDEVNNPDVAKYRLLLRRMVREAAMNRDRSISAGSTSLTYFLIAMFISLAQNIKSRFSSMPTDKTDFTVIAMRNLVGYIFTMCASGTTPLSNIWQVLSYYPTHVPAMNAFELKDLWILKNLIDMFPYCLWSVAEPNFKKNTLCGCVKLLSKYIITKDLEKIAADEKKDMTLKTVEISKKLTIVWQWQKLVVISIMKMLFKSEKKEPYDNILIKHVATRLLESYPDIDETMISFKHKKSDSSKKLKFMLGLMAKRGNISLTEYQMKTLKNIISKRMHTFYHKYSKEGRRDMFDKLKIQDVYKELGKLVKYEDDGKGPSNKYFNSWALSYSADTKDIITSKEVTFDTIKSMFTIDDGSATGATASKLAEGAGAGLEGDDESCEDAIVIKYPDMREAKWLAINDVSKMSKFIHDKDLDEIISILEFVFKGADINVYSVIIDIVGILLDEYKDRAKAYDIILRKYKFN
jgi:hypothetical protein